MCIRDRAKREAKRERVLEEHGDYYKVISRNALSKSAIEAAKGVSYKASGQTEVFFMARCRLVAKRANDNAAKRGLQGKQREVTKRDISICHKSEQDCFQHTDRAISKSSHLMFRDFLHVFLQIDFSHKSIKCQHRITDVPIILNK